MMRRDPIVLPEYDFVRFGRVFGYRVMVQLDGLAFPVRVYVDDLFYTGGDDVARAVVARVGS